jgi:hypothetical protein
MLFGRFGKGTKEAALDYVLQHRCPERQLDLRGEFPFSDAEVRNALMFYAAALRECAADFLRGDPSVVRDVQPLVEKEHRRALRRMRQEERQAPAKRKDVNRTRT